MLLVLRENVLFPRKSFCSWLEKCPDFFSLRGRECEAQDEEDMVTYGFNAMDFFF